ncbi:hypothetical protein HY17_05560 [Hyphomonas sp. CY54-11-8]|nr:hypothetical protein HY17_05560 [Hyphomonas sp. CY54-11-8]
MGCIEVWKTDRTKAGGDQHQSLAALRKPYGWTVDYLEVDAVVAQLLQESLKHWLVRKWRHIFHCDQIRL